MDEFCEYWNNHLLRRQDNKQNASGTSPRHAWQAPEDVRVDAQQCYITVDLGWVRELRRQLGGEEGRKQALSFVSPEFQVMADEAYERIGSPLIDLTNAWTVFTAMVQALQDH